MVKRPQKASEEQLFFREKTALLSGELGLLTKSKAWLGAGATRAGGLPFGQDDLPYG